MTRMNEDRLVLVSALSIALRCGVPRMMYRWYRAAIVIACLATGCEASDSEPPVEESGDGGACEAAEPLDVVMHARGAEYLGTKPLGCIGNFRAGCLRCSDGLDQPPRLYAKIGSDDAISFSMEGGGFVRRERCTRDDCTTTLVTYQAGSGASVTTEIDEDIPVRLDLAPGTYSADLTVIYESDDGDYHGLFPTGFGLIVEPADGQD
jgi:hypothetical protein